MMGLCKIWQPYIDFQVTVDANKIIAHIKKHVTKQEIKISQGMNNIIEEIFVKCYNNELTTKVFF